MSDIDVKLPLRTVQQRMIEALTQPAKTPEFEHPLQPLIGRVLSGELARRETGKAEPVLVIGVGEGRRALLSVAEVRHILAIMEGPELKAAQQRVMKEG